MKKSAVTLKYSWPLLLTLLSLQVQQVFKTVTQTVTGHYIHNVLYTNCVDLSEREERVYNRYLLIRFVC